MKDITRRLNLLKIQERQRQLNSERAQVLNHSPQSRTTVNGKIRTEDSSRNVSAEGKRQSDITPGTVTDKGGHPAGIVEADKRPRRRRVHPGSSMMGSGKHICESIKSLFILPSCRNVCTCVCGETGTSVTGRVLSLRLSHHRAENIGRERGGHLRGMQLTHNCYSDLTKKMPLSSGSLRTRPGPSASLRMTGFRAVQKGSQPATLPPLPRPMMAPHTRLDTATVREAGAAAVRLLAPSTARMALSTLR